jgi:deazaflavin-dependent oxidoreductase (nitroreductase family)
MAEGRRWRPWVKIAVAVTIAGVANVILLVREAEQGNAQRLALLKSLESRLANPVFLRLAGSRPWGISRFEHRGRRSGALYATPLWALPSNGGFVLAMPYGAESDWVKNLLARGEADLVRNDVRYRVDQPRVVPVAATGATLPLRMRALTSLLDIQNVMRVDIAPPGSATPRPTT